MCSGGFRDFLSYSFPPFDFFSSFFFFPFLFSLSDRPLFSYKALCRVTKMWGDEGDSVQGRSHVSYLVRQGNWNVCAGLLEREQGSWFVNIQGNGRGASLIIVTLLMKILKLLDISP
jgi:hypothetical protein